MLYDAHVHVHNAAFLKVMKDQGVTGIANASSENEYQFLCKHHELLPTLIISAGIHPWHIEVSWEEMYPIFEEVPLIGEIGLDNVWCQKDIEQQHAVFERQLQYAAARKKPVILHVKGMEKDALRLLKKYPNTYLIHWYSCMDYLYEYIQLGCYFTIGPSLLYDSAVQQVAKYVPLHHLLIETDGMDALSWSEKRVIDSSEYASFLKRSLLEIAVMRNTQPYDLQNIIEQNYAKFTKTIKTKKKV